MILSRSLSPSSLRPLVLAIALSTGAIAMPASAQQAVPSQPNVQGTLLSVSAVGEARRVPDIATLSTGVVTRAPDARAAMQANATEMDKVVAAI
ncbi:SIMPL domain-containing protein, partial [Lysobacter sp. D1-1-M9]|uniref:SIMPL domain-containing protein n=1 Tax=Novilysobacter longmucuonensis TaxID=3098603 RepID=UPI002FC97927